jgi:hypothetical protein
MPWRKRCSMGPVMKNMLNKVTTKSQKLVLGVSEKQDGIPEHKREIEQ